MKVKWKLDIVAEDWKSLPISANHGQVNPKRFMFRLHHHHHQSLQYTIPIHIQVSNIREYIQNVEQISLTNTHSLEHQEDEGNACAGCKKLRASKI